MRDSMKFFQIIFLVMIVVDFVEFVPALIDFDVLGQSVSGAVTHNFAICANPHFQ